MEPSSHLTTPGIYMKSPLSDAPRDHKLTRFTGGGPAGGLRHILLAAACGHLGRVEEGK